MNRMFLITGVPGSGKSTKAEFIKNLYKNTHCKTLIEHFEADMFFMKDGEYKWNPKQLPNAHEWCKKSVEHAMSIGHDVIVSNTFITAKERKPYFDLAKAYKYNIQVIECTGTYQNIHGVSEKKVEALRAKYEPVQYEEVNDEK